MSTEETDSSREEKAMRFMSILKFSEHKVPTFEIVRGKPYVYYGANNLYPEYLIKLFTRSAKHNALITGKKEYVVGKGFYIDEDELGGGSADNPVLTKFISQINPGESANDLLEKVALDFELFGGFALQVVYERLGTNIASLYHIDFSRIRAGKFAGQNFRQKKGDDTVFDFYYSDDWSAFRQTTEKTMFRGFNVFDPSKAATEKSQIIYFKEYRPVADVYPMPDYIGCIPYIELDYEIANYQLNNVKRGFAASFMISLHNGEPSTEEKYVIENQYKRKFTGTDNAGEIVITYDDNVQNAPTLQALNIPDLNKRLIALNESVQSEIFTGHKITSGVLFGVKTPGQLGGRDELREASELFQNTYINHKQQVICRFFNQLLNNGYKVPGKPLKIQPTEPLKWELPGNIMATAMTKDEVRENGGLRPLNIKGVSDILPPAVTVTEPAVKLSSVQFSKESNEKLISCFAKHGLPIKDLNVLKSRQVRFLSDESFEPMPEKMYFDSVLKGSVSTMAAAILKHLKANPGASAEDIAAETNIPVEQVTATLGQLTAEGYIGGNNKLTSAGRGYVNGGSTQVIIEARYTYEVMPGLGESVIPGTRDFCKQLIELGRAYTRQEIQMISDEVGYSAWLYRGGFYHNPETDITTPYCRHDWFQKIIRREV